MERETIKFLNPKSRKIFLTKWLDLLVRKSAFKVSNIDLSDSKDWSFDGEIIKHRSGKFFQVVGLEWIDDRCRIKRQPFLAQREIGVLGFLMRYNKEATELLVQAKIEPGNVRRVQIAPTCQATESNATRVHGGSYPPYLKYFITGNRINIYDKNQSEQGTRFYKKLNRNVLVLTQEKTPIMLSHKWIAAKDLLYFLRFDYLINTDARSVLVCSPWDLLINRAPFSCNKKGFGLELAKSYQSSTNYISLRILKSKLKKLRSRAKKPKIIKLSELKDWRINKNGLYSVDNKSFLIKQIKVRISSREVPKWDQPIIESLSEGKVVLFCGRHKGVLHFLFRASDEPGLYNKIELTPNIVIEPGKKEDKFKPEIFGGKKIVDCHQSEEGGRFFKDKNHFQIIDREEIFKPQTNYFWLTLKQIRQLLNEEGWFTNEARSAISLLLYWL